MSCSNVLLFLDVFKKWGNFIKTLRMDYTYELTGGHSEPFMTSSVRRSDL